MAVWWCNFVVFRAVFGVILGVFEVVLGYFRNVLCFALLNYLFCDVTNVF